MSFLSPYMLWGAAAAGIPIALHFFFRSRYRTVPWAAMKFLLTSIEQTSRRLRFQELLLLILRVTLLVLLAMALARPLGSFTGGGRGQAVDAVFLFDVSYSMGARDGEVDRLGRAKIAAKKVLDQLPPHSTVQIIASADRVDADSVLGPREPADLDKAREIIDNLKLTSLATDLYPGVEKSREVLQSSKSPNKEFYLFSDMQKTGWEQNSGGLTNKLQDIRDMAAVNLVRCGDPARTLKDKDGKPVSALRNAAIVGITPQSGTPRPGERVGFAVLVKNTGTTALKDLQVTLMVDNDKNKMETQTLKEEIGPGKVHALTITAKLPKPGPRVITAQIKDDDMDGDNRFDQVIQVRDKINVLVVDGSPNDKEPEKASSFHIEHALYLRGYDFKTVPAKLASPALLQNKDICILVNVLLKADSNVNADALASDFLPELEKFVVAGKGLMVFPGDMVMKNPKVFKDQYNNLLYTKHGLMPSKILGFMEVRTKGKSTEDNFLEINRDSFSMPAFWKFKDDQNYQAFNGVFANRALDMDEPAVPLLKDKVDAEKKDKGKDAAKKNTDPLDIEAQVLLRYSRFPSGEKAEKSKEKAYGDGKPAVLWRKVGAGQVFFVTTAPLEETTNVVLLNPKGKEIEIPVETWNNWIQIQAAWFPFLDVSFAQLLQGQDQTHNIIAGQPLNWFPTAKEAEAQTKADLPYLLMRPDGTEERLGLPTKPQDGRGRAMVTAKNLTQAGIYRLRGGAAPKDKAAKTDKKDKKNEGIPIAVTPDLRESSNLEAITEAEIDKNLGFKPTYIISGSEVQGSDRVSQEWTVWLLFIVLFVAVGESTLAWWCGRAW